MELVKYVAIILFIFICLAKLVSVMRLSEKDRGTETNVIKANGAVFFFNEKNERGRLLGILCLTCIIFILIFILFYR
ncbi:MULTISPECIES: hypothetical protein [Streptococcus]|uniref:Protein-export membrane protein SecG n=1 Tax=Streptococcus suis TaxID=1307 RepID=A0A9X4MQZ4_STRSU|nr:MULTISPECIES: hypothetical protein [Streptococcus]MBY5026478.1 hypothetical protein [Streptococcus suis]MDG4520284.1 hypothetical protein [Streptococcus suis]MDG4526642.1 hypothetical protein [Streptococcus suis]MDG4529038.1 hypothetical protein [Streptococcus suis]QZT18198.1 hypothetical protein K6974_04190 [Streptococcus suis]